MVDVADHVRVMIDEIPTPAWACRPDGTTEFINRRWLEYTGLSMEQSLGWGWQEPIHPHDLPGLMRTWTSLLVSGAIGAAEARLRGIDGQYRWFLFRVVPVRDENGNLVRWYGTNTDIEELKVLQASLTGTRHELEAERDRLRLLLGVQQALAVSLDLRSLFQALAADLRRVTDCNFIGLALPEPGTPDLRQRLVDYAEGQGPISEGMVLPLHGSASGKAFRTRQLICLGEAHLDPPDPEIYGTPEGQRFHQLALDGQTPIGYFLPLIHDGQVIGVMQLTNYGGKIIKAQQASFLSAVASQVARAVSGALQLEALVASRDQLARERVYLREEIELTSMFEEIVGSSKPLRETLRHVSRVAPYDSTVLILGETGTGKELIARAIHRRSPRSGQAFIRVNCAAIPPALMASELFGHEKGAFTGAMQRRVGRFELAHAGTIFLDEIGELPVETQIAMLRVLQEREFERVGGSTTISIDVRVLAATNRDLRAAVAAATFREDLFYRLSVFPIQVPSLREREDDIPLLIEYLIERYAQKMGKKIKRVEPRSMAILRAYRWPGNIRELQNVVERAVILCDGDTFFVDEAWFSSEPARGSRPPAAPVASGLRLGEDEEKKIIEAALSQSKGQVGGPSGAASRLGIPRQTVESKIARLGIKKHHFKSA